MLANPRLSMSEEQTPRISRGESRWLDVADATCAYSDRHRVEGWSGKAKRDGRAFQRIGDR